MPSVRESIEKIRSGEVAARQQAAREVAAASQLANQESARKLIEIQRITTQSRDVVNRALNESGVLEAINDLTRNYIDGKFSKQALIINYLALEEGPVHAFASLDLVWGKAFAIEGEGFQSIVPEKPIFGILGASQNYYSFNLHVSEMLVTFYNATVLYREEVPRESGSFNRQQIFDLTASAFLNAKHVEGVYRESKWERIERERRSREGWH